MVRATPWSLGLLVSPCVPLFRASKISCRTTPDAVAEAEGFKYQTSRTFPSKSINSGGGSGSRNNTPWMRLGESGAANDSMSFMRTLSYKENIERTTDASKDTREIETVENCMQPCVRGERDNLFLDSTVPYSLGLLRGRAVENVHSPWTVHSNGLALATVLVARHWRYVHLQYQHGVLYSFYESPLDVSGVTSQKQHKINQKPLAFS